MQVQDHVGIYQTPVGLDCIKWSQDNLIAVAAGQAITIFSPAALGGPRAFAPYRSIDTSAVAPGFTPKEWQDSPQFAMSAFYEVNMKSAVSDQGWRNIAWSPVGCAMSGGCYLAALSADFKVFLLAPPVSAMSSAWHEVADVTKLFQDYMAATGWKEVDCLAVGSEHHEAGADGVLRLRGGCSTPAVCISPAGATGSCRTVPAPAGSAGPDQSLAPGLQMEVGAPVLRLRGGGLKENSTAEADASVDLGDGNNIVGNGGSDGFDGAIVDAQPDDQKVEDGLHAAVPGAIADAVSVLADKTAAACGNVATAVASRLGRPLSGTPREQVRGKSKPRASSRGRAGGDGGKAGHAAPTAGETGSLAADAKTGAGDDPPATKGGKEELAMAPPAKRPRRSGRASWGAGFAATTIVSDGVPAGSRLENMMASPDKVIGLGENGAAAASTVVEAGLGKPGPSGSKGTARPRRKVAGPQVESTPFSSSGVSAAAAQLREGQRVEVHNDEEGLTGGWFQGQLVKLSAPQYCYGLVVYDELQVSEEPGSPMLTEWFPLPGCPRLLSPAAARSALPPGPGGVAYPVHSRRGYAVRPAPPSEVAPCPVPPPLRLGMMVEVLHDSAWWTVLLVGVTGPPEAVAAAGRGTTMAAHGDDGQTGIASGVILHGRLLDGKVAVSVPLELSRAVAVWDPNMGSWSAPEPHSFLPARPHHFCDVMLLEGGSTAAAVLEPLLVNRVEAHKEAAEGARTELEHAEEGASWAAAVEAAGEEMLRAFSLEFTLLQLDGAWLWGVVRERLAALQGASHPEQLTPPRWAAASAATTARVGSEGCGNLGQGHRRRSHGVPQEGSTLGGSTGGSRRRTGRGADRERTGSIGVEGNGAVVMGSGKPAGNSGQGDATDLLDFTGIDPGTFRQYDTRPDPNKGGAGLEKAAPGMIAKRFSALQSAADPSMLRVYVPGERLTGTELQLYARAYGEFMHLYGSQLPEGADRRITTAAKQRCRQVLHSSLTLPVGGDAEERGADLTPGAASNPAKGAIATVAGEGRQRGPAKRCRTSTEGGLAEGSAGNLTIKSEPDKDGSREFSPTAAAGMFTASGRRRSAAAAMVGSARKGPGRRSMGRASDVAPVMDFSCIDPDTFRQYDTRPDPNERGVGLEKVAPGMILSRWQALITTADPGDLRAYKPFEKMSGVELNMYDQAYCEFLYLYGDKLPDGAAKRIHIEAKRRVRRQLRTVADENEEGAPPDGSQQHQQHMGATGVTPLTTKSGRVARAAAVRAAAAARRQCEGAMAGAGSSEDGDDAGDKKGGDALPFGLGYNPVQARQSRASGAAVKSLPVAGPPKRGCGVQSPIRGEDGGYGASDYSLPTESESKDFSSGSESLGDEEREDDESGDEGEDGMEDVIGEEEDERPRRGRGRVRGGRSGRGGGGGRPRGGGNSQARPSSREEEDAANTAVSSVVEAATSKLFEPLAPAINLNDPQMLQKHGGYIVYKRYMELRGKCDPTQLPAYSRGEHLRGADLRMFVQAYGEFMKVFGALLPAGADKKIKTHTKSTIRRRVIQSHKNASDKPERAAGPAGSRRVTPQQSVLWTGKRRQGVREAAGVQGTLFMGYGEGGGSEEGEELQASKDGEGGEGPEAFSSVERWENTVAIWGRRSRLRYQVELTRGSAETVEGWQPTARQPSYAIRFYGYVKDDHRDIPLENCAASDVTNGPVLPTAVYEARALALAATCLAWSPTYCANRGGGPTCNSAASAGAATTPNSPAAPAATATVTTAEQSDGVTRYCVLAIGNKLGQVAMWRLGLPAEYVHRMQDKAERSGSESKITAGIGPLSTFKPSQQSKCSDAETSSGASSSSSPLLQWMGSLQVHRGGAHVLRLTWCVAPECRTAAAAATNSGQGTQVPGPATSASSGQWHVPQPHSAGQRDSLLLLTGLSDGSILLWSASAATFTRASDLTLLSEVCPPDGLAPTAIDCTWLLLSDPLRHQTRHQLTTFIANTNSHINRPANEMRDITAQHQPQRGRAVDGTARAQQRKDTEVEAVQFGVADVPDAEEVEDSGALKTGDGDAYNQDYDYGIGATTREAQGWEAGHTGGPWGRRLLIVASKPCGAVFAWRSGCWRPRTAEPEEAPMQADSCAVAADGIDKVCAGDLATACRTVNGAASCLHSGVHGSFHCGGVALAAGRPLVVSGGTDGAVKSWLVSELELPMSAVGAVPLPSRRRYLPPTLQLTELPEGIHRLDPCSASLPELPPQVQSLPLARQAVHGVAASGNGLVFAVLRTTSTRQLDIAKNVMIHGRVLGGSVHLMTPYSMAAAATPPLPLLPRMLAAGLMFQAPVASCLWDIHAMTLRAGMVEAIALPSVPAEAWDTEMDCEATVVDDAAALEQVQGTVGGNMDDGADGGGAGAGGNMDLGRARLAALVRQDTEERRRAKLMTRLQQLTATKLMLAALEHFIEPLEAPYNAAAADADATTSLYMTLGGARAWAWCGLRCATALRRLALSYAAARADPPGALPNEQLADVDMGVLAALQEAGIPAAAATMAPAALLACRDTAARHEGELLQAHIWTALKCGIEYCMRQPLARMAAQPPSLYKLLMADWVTLHLRHPMLREAELLPLTVNVYLSADEAPPLDCPPRARETVSLTPQPVSLTGSDMLQSASVAECCCNFETTSTGNNTPKQQQQPANAAAAVGPGPRPAAAGTVGSLRGVLGLPRCGATLAVCESLGAWNCVLCARRYLLPPTRRPQECTSPNVPYCLFCGIRLGNGALADNFLRQPSLPAAGDVLFAS